MPLNTPLTSISLASNTQQFETTNVRHFWLSHLIDETQWIRADHGMSQFNLFSCHKYLERFGGNLLFQLATCDSHDVAALANIRTRMSEFSSRLKGHATWEEHFVFNLLPVDAVANEQAYHARLDEELDLIRRDLEQQHTASSLHDCYLRFRKIYCELLAHLHDEETHLMRKLRERLSEQDLRLIDRPIYKDMNADDMASMVEELFPPCNLGEKLAVLEDLKAANANVFADAWPRVSDFV